MYDDYDRLVSRGIVRGSSDDGYPQEQQRRSQRSITTPTNHRRSGGHLQQPRQHQQQSSDSNRRRSGGGGITPGGGIMKQSSFSTKSCSSGTFCKSTGEFCAAGHELLQIPTLDRQRYLQRKQLQQLQQNASSQHSISSIALITASKATPASSIIIECDCCSKIISKSIHDNEYIAGCCLECDIDVCSHCFKNGQSYEDVVLKEWSRINNHDNNNNSANTRSSNDDNDEEQQLMPEQHQQQQQYHNNNNNNEQRPQRYNRCRPTYIGTGRVNYDDYPDPTVYQWSFTGSSSNENENDENQNYNNVEVEEEISFYPIEYFEKDFGNEIGIIQLDFYYTIGMIQTYLVHPYDGRTDLFTTRSTPKKLSTDSYRKILKDPRSYNNERYKKKQQQAL
ncbi:hypothetical protein FRACYDRAFT_246801 [Fragilariopsis cylindrus CCMP1102]|uniref:Uncharacterized protein n=1 Tax=Fragilariopsis cylindrus CCMP1102 TaxID=635003 RepID=A0A1E7EYL7_9STRA|nr:hypothetical protein FRACYDRAFT_246801 [Fragilariopsis cylindrus CCMP1102]|eukprot:OEU10926.1 hypothetical protein FRACYDRAFT_246801 [Fragilariopsis cylindrus CCMP1102]